VHESETRSIWVNDIENPSIRMANSSPPRDSICTASLMCSGAPCVLNRLSQHLPSTTDTKHSNAKHSLAEILAIRPVSAIAEFTKILALSHSPATPRLLQAIVQHLHVASELLEACYLRRNSSCSHEMRKAKCGLSYHTDPLYL
jgi:hypothetical protein